MMFHVKRQAGRSGDVSRETIHLSPAFASLTIPRGQAKILFRAENVLIEPVFHLASTKQCP